MNNDLISRSALRKEIDLCDIETFNDKFTICEQIANAPTVDAVVLPCKVGRTVFFVCAMCDEKGEESFAILVGEIVSFSMQKEGLWAYCRYEDGLTYWHKVLDDFGRTVFLTKEAAEAALAKMDQEG